MARELSTPSETRPPVFYAVAALRGDEGKPLGSLVIPVVPADDRRYCTLGEHEFGRDFQIAEPDGLFGQHLGLQRGRIFALLRTSLKRVGHGEPPPSSRGDPRGKGFVYLYKPRRPARQAGAVDLARALRAHRTHYEEGEAGMPKTTLS